MPLPAPVRSAAEFAFRTAGARFRSSKRVTRWVFGLELTSRERPVLWDLALLALRAELPRAIGDARRVLEVGTGEVGVLSLVVARALPSLDVHAVDVNPQFVDCAHENAVQNGAQVRFFVSDLFSDVTGRYDVIFSAPPYVPRAWGDAHRHRGGDPECVWDGGEDGLDVVRRLATDAPAHLAPGGRLLIATSDFYHRPDEVRPAFEGYHVESRRPSAWNPTRLWVLTRAPSGDPR